MKGHDPKNIDAVCEKGACKTVEDQKREMWRSEPRIVIWRFALVSNVSRKSSCTLQQINDVFAYRELLDHLSKGQTSYTCRVCDCNANYSGKGWCDEDFFFPLFLFPQKQWRQPPKLLLQHNASHHALHAFIINHLTTLEHHHHIIH